jgi:hypothetical protein
MALGRYFNLGRLKFVERIIKKWWFGGMLSRETLKIEAREYHFLHFWSQNWRTYKAKMLKKFVSLIASK